MDFKIGDKVRIIKNIADDFQGVKIGDIGEVVDLGNKSYDYEVYLKINKHILYGFKKEELELIEEEIYMEKSFLEVISDIKEGEVWESDSAVWDIKSIEKIGDFISIKKRNDSKELCIRPDCKFILKKKEYSFNEAFKEYEKGNIEIENIETGTRYKKIEGKDMIFSNLYKKWADLSSVVLFSADDLRGKWYINN